MNRRHELTPVASCIAIPLSSIVKAMAESGSLFEFIESKIFSTQINQLGAEVLLRIQSDLVQDPERGAIVKGTHGVRKARVAKPTVPRGKSGSYRYLYLYLEQAGRIHLLYLFSKNEQAGLSSSQKRIIGALSQEIRKE